MLPLVTRPRFFHGRDRNLRVFPNFAALLAVHFARFADNSRILKLRLQRVRDR
jgi:hypothetical protein